MKLGRRMGNDRSTLSDAVSDISAIHGQIGGAWTAEPAIVHDYDFENQRVDLLLRNRKGADILRNVPIVGTGGDVRVIRPMKTAKDWVSDPNNRPFPFPDTGVVLYMRSDSTDSFSKAPNPRNSDLWTTPRVSMLHQKLGAIFIPQVHLENEALPTILDNTATNSTPYKVGPADFALVHKDGSAVIIKGDGKLVLSGDVITKNLYPGQGNLISKYLTATASWDPPSLATQEAAQITVSVSGASVGDTCIADLSTIGTNPVMISGVVSSSGNVRVTIFNAGSSTLDLGSGTLRVSVIKS